MTRRVCCGMMRGMSITLVAELSEEDVWFVRRSLREYNTRHLETRDERRYAAFSSGEGGARDGGIVFTEFGNWLEIDYLWVDEAQRRRGIGSRLLHAALSQGRDHGCTHAFTNTYSFQALPFYRKIGFDIVFEQKHYPITSSRYFLTKAL